MTESKFTKGPWEVGKWKDGQEVYIDAPYGEPDFHTSRWEGLAVVFGSDDEDYELGHQKCLANAHIIAASPDLYAVAKALESWWRKPNDRRTIEAIEPVITMALEALQKAEGRS